MLDIQTPSPPGEKAMSTFKQMPRVPRFSFYDRAVLVITAYGPRVMGGGTAYGQLMKGGVSRGTAPG